MFYNLANRALSKFGYRIAPLTSQGWSPKRIRKNFSNVRTVFDIGVGRGTLPLYEAFPTAYHVLIEPVEEFLPSIREILVKYKGEHLRVAIGSCLGEEILYVDNEDPQKSSILERTDLTKTDSQLTKKRIRVETLDNIIAGKTYEKPFGLKLDTEGYEYNALLGAENFLKNTEFVIAEVSVIERFQDSYTFLDFANLMRDRGFSLFDIMHCAYNQKISATPFVDAFFVRSES